MMKVMKTLYCCCILLFLFNCVSKKELDSLNEISRFYGGDVNLTYGFIASTRDEDNETNGKYFKITVTGSTSVQQFENLSLPASNIAYLFVKNLSKENLENYSYIVVIIKNEGPDYKEEYSIASLQEIKKQLPIFNKVSLLLKSKNYPELFSRFHKEVTANLDENKFKQETEDLDSIYGKIESLQFQGFTYSTEQIGETYSDLIRLSGVLVREKQNTQFSITIDPAIKKRKITGVRFVF